MVVAIFGIEGQLGTELAAALSEHTVVPLPHGRVEVTDRGAVADAVAAEKPDWVINTAGMTHVDKCEDEERRAFEVNALGGRYVALAAAAAGARLIHISTDYVFDGEKGAPYVESDDTGPVNVYGASKLAGECLVRAAGPAHFILRTSGLYGLSPCRGKGTNFVETMLRLGGERDELTVVEDEVLTPTFTRDLATHVATIIEHPPAAGTYHATNEGQCSWFDFAREIFRLSDVDVKLKRIKAADWQAPARRPAFSVLDNAGLRKAGINKFPEWQDALRRYLEQRGV